MMVHDPFSRLDARPCVLLATGMVLGVLLALSSGALRLQSEWLYLSC
jgi:hypothetical protein